MRIPAILCAALMLCWGAAASAQEPDEYDLSGSLKVADDLIAEGTVRAPYVTATSLVSTGDMNVSGRIYSKDVAVYLSPVLEAARKKTDGEKTINKTSSLGAYLYCALASVQITGEDNNSDDTALCSVSRDSTGAWTLRAYLSGMTNSAKCSAACLNLPMAQSSSVSGAQ